MSEKDDKEEVKKYLGDQLWRLNNLYWITDERGEKFKFKLNDIQEDFFKNMWYLNVILKARQLGFSTFILLFLLDNCLFRRNIRAGIIAHSLDDATVLFKDKIKFAYDHLPKWLVEILATNKNSSKELVFSNNSSIRVGTSMRSSTLNYLHVSELGKISRKYPEKSEEIKTGALNTVHAGQFIFLESTAEGRDGLFFQICQEAQRKVGKLTPLDFKFFFYPWYIDKRYVADPNLVVLTSEEIKYFEDLKNNHSIELSAEQKAWYVLKWHTQQLGVNDKMRQEYPSTPKEAFEKKLSGSYYGEIIARLRNEKHITDIVYDPSLPVNTYWDLGRNDTNAIWFVQFFGGKQYRCIDYYENNGESLHHYAKVLKDKGYIYGEHFLPHDVAVTDISQQENKSRQEVLEDLGVRPLNIVPKIGDIGEGVDMTRNILPLTWFDESKCDKGLKALEAYQKEWDDKGGTYKDRPRKHFWANHAADAFRQLAQSHNANPKPKLRRRKGNWRTV